MQLAAPALAGATAMRTVATIPAEMTRSADSVRQP
jgi:hypothetical protein